MKKVRAVCDLETDRDTLPGGTVLEVVEVVEGFIVLQAENGDMYSVSSDAFEAGFEIAEL